MASARLATGLAVFVLLISWQARGQERPDPTRELTARTYSGLLLEGGNVLAGTTFGLVLYRLPAPRPSEGEPQPVLVGPEPVVLLPDSVNDLFATEGRVYVANGPPGIRIVPFNAERTRPLTEGIVEIETAGAALSVAVEGSLLVAALGVMGVAAWDVSDPTCPAPLFGQDTGGYARHVLVRTEAGENGLPQGLTVFVANGRKGVARLRLAADRASVLETGLLESAGDVRRLHLFRDGLLFSRGRQGLCYVDATLTPESVACVPSGDVVRGIAAAGDTVIAADGGAGLLLVGWSDPQKPGAPVHFPLGEGSANRVTVAGDSVIVAADFQGIRVFSLSELQASTSSRPQEEPR